MRVSFIHEGNWFKVKVTGAEKVKNSYSHNGHNSSSVKHTAMRFACSMGFSAMADQMV